jgi:hypothetical protein
VREERAFKILSCGNDSSDTRTLHGPDLRLKASGGTPDGSVLLQPHVLLPIGGLVVLALIPAVLKRFRHRPASHPEHSS